MTFTLRVKANIRINNFADRAYVRKHREAVIEQAVRSVTDFFRDEGFHEPDAEVNVTVDIEDEEGENE